MQEITHVIILAIIQGLTEFLPVSSSAHLILFPKLLGWADQGLAFDVAIHLGTLCAVLWYFRKELTKIITKEHRLGWAIVFGTIPVGLAGLIWHSDIEMYLRATWVIAATTLIFGVLLGIAAYTGKQRRDEHHITWKDVAIIGCSQAIALIPGTSRSGITLTAGLFAGLTRTAAARFSFLLSIPVILLAACLEAYKVYNLGDPVDWQGMSVGFVIAGVTGYLCIDLFLRIIEKFGIMPFVIYRLLLGIVLIYALSL